ncbi:MAG: DUF748 domain-containing protein [Deltaproteobacteria bacterium]|nr:DUF748 domain-containing protein [Deltaproteobacteria bacterium]
MRRFLLGLVVLFAVLAGAAVFAAMNLDAYVNRNREVVAKRVEAALGREVEFGEVGISFAGGLGVHVADLRVGDDPAFSQDDFVHAAALDVRVALLPALFGRIEVVRVVLRSPRVQLIQTKDGLSIDSLGGGGRAGGVSGRAPEESAAGGGTAFLVSLLNVEDGELRFEDRTAKPPVELRVTRLDAEATELSMTEPVDFTVRAAVLGSEAQNFRASVRVGPVDAKAPRAEVELRLDLPALGEALKLPAVRAALPAELVASGALQVEAKAKGTADAIAFDASLDAKDARLRYGEDFDKPAGQAATLVVRGKREGEVLTIDSADLRVGDLKLHATASLSGGHPRKLSFRADTDELRPAAFGATSGEKSGDDVVREPVLEGSFTLPDSGPRGQATLRSPSGKVGGGEYRNLVVEVAMAAKRVTLEKLEADAFEGRLAASGRYDMSQATPRFSLSAMLIGMQVEALVVATGGGPAPLTGKIDGQFDLAGAGSGWDEMKPRLGATGNARIADGVLRKFNPAGDTLDFLASLPVTNAAAVRQVMKAHPRAFGEEDAPFESLDASFELREGWLELRKLVLGTEEYDFIGSGRYSLEGEAKLDTQLIFARPVSDELVAAEPYLRYTRRSDGRLQVPVAIRGTSPKLAVRPDVTRLGQTAAREALTEWILDGAGVRTTPQAEPAPSETPQGDPAPTAEPTRPATGEDVGREVLRRGLEDLLGGQRKQTQPTQPTDPAN